MQKLITNIVFTKNRPLQLDAYLESLYRHFPAERIQTYIVYKVELFSEEYASLFKKYSDCRVVREGDFHTDCLNIINQADTKFILFGIDDVVFFDSVDLDLINRTFCEQENNIFAFTLRFSPESLTNSNDEIADIMIGDQKVYRLNWKNGQTPHSRYPFELCCTVYSTESVKKIINGTMNNDPLIKKIFSPNTFLIKLLQKTKFARKILKSFGYFFSPNTLESWPCRWCQNNGGRLPDYTYFQKHCASAIQVNMVNTSNRSVLNGSVEHTVEALNDKYKQGYRFDSGFITPNNPPPLSCGQQYFKLTKCVKEIDR